jgi:hypothetical protein
MIEADQKNNVVALYDREQEDAAALERTLKPFNPDSVPYNKEAIIQMGKRFADGMMGNGAGFGMCLVLLEKHEDRQTFTAIIEEHFPWVNERTYRYLTRFVRFCAKSPKFMKLFGRQGMMSKGMALLTGLADPQIDELLIELDETGEVKGLTEADLLGKTYKQIVLENKRLRLEMDHKVEAATEKAEKENQLLKKRLEALEAADEDVNRGRKLLEAGDKLLTDGLATLAKADFMLLRKDAAAVAIGRDLIAKVRRIADHLEAEMFG